MPNKTGNKKMPQDLNVQRKLDVGFLSQPKEELAKQLGVVPDEVPAGYIAGWASTPSKDMVCDVVLPGAFAKSISEKGVSGPQGIKLLLDHDWDKPAGQIVKMEQRPEGLWMEAELDLDVSYVKDRYSIAKKNGGLSFSIGYRLVEDGFEFIDKGEDSFWLLSELDLHEVSVVVFPCNKDAEMTFVKGAGDFDSFEDMAALEKALVATGKVASRNEANALTRAVKRIAKLESSKEDEPVSASEEKALADISAQLAELRKALSE